MLLYVCNRKSAHFKQPCFTGLIMGGEKMKKVLIVEDKPEQQEIARKIIKEAGHYCYVAEDLHEAILSILDEDIIINNINLSPEKKWDAIITDLHFPMITGEKGKPELYGFEVMLACKKMHIPFSVCTDLNFHEQNCLWAKRLCEKIGARGISSQKIWGLALYQLSI